MPEFILYILTTPLVVVVMALVWLGEALVEFLRPNLRYRLMTKWQWQERGFSDDE